MGYMGILLSYTVYPKPHSIYFRGTTTLYKTAGIPGFFLGDDEDGQLVFGGVDDRHFEGKFHFVPVVTQLHPEPGR